MLLTYILAHMHITHTKGTCPGAVVQGGFCLGALVRRQLYGGFCLGHLSRGLLSGDTCTRGYVSSRASVWGHLSRGRMSVIQCQHIELSRLELHALLSSVLVVVFCCHALPIVAHLTTTQLVDNATYPFSRISCSWSSSARSLSRSFGSTLGLLATRCFMRMYCFHNF